MNEKQKAEMGLDPRVDESGVAAGSIGIATILFVAAAVIYIIFH